MKRAIFISAGVVCLVLPWLSKGLATYGAPIALTLGIALALSNLSAFPKESKKLSRMLIQVAIVLLGLSIDLHQVIDAGVSGLAFAAGTIVGTFALGYTLARLLNVEKILATLLSSGTAICGGSAIAATGSVIRAGDGPMSVALACVFVLNAVALYIFPPIGHALDLSQEQFGAWAAVAIHDVSSVVGAAAQYGPQAVDEATVIKLVRTLWIVPVSIGCAWALKRGPFERENPDQRADDARTEGLSPSAFKSPAKGAKKKLVALPLPWFIVLFVVAAGVRTALPEITDIDGVDVAGILRDIAKNGAMVLALFLIGAGLSRKAIAGVGWRPFALAIGLWIAIASVSLVVIRQTVPNTDAVHGSAQERQTEH